MTQTLYDHGDLCVHIAEFLYRQGICHDPNQMQVDAEIAAVFIDSMEDTPTLALGLTVTSEDYDTDDANPRIAVAISHRASDHDGLAQLTQSVFNALHDRTRFDLTAAQSVLLSRRTLRGAVAFDQNNRLRRTDIYQFRLLVPET
ncbi:hypothetical protein FRC0393_00639 [Corynebacterium diphtheriae]|nr:hypothetical protein FRC0383_00638 [Corynebacterium diphtheriae]CAB0878258.1 hypothetical protein FRC0393_00639 [Corynebacterium diphtheriae]